MEPVEFTRGFSDLRVAETPIGSGLKSVTAVWFSVGLPEGGRWYMLLWRLANVCEMACMRLSWHCCRAWLRRPDVPRVAKMSELLAVPWRLFKYVVLGKNAGVLRYAVGEEK